MVVEKAVEDRRLLDCRTVKWTTDIDELFTE